MIDTLARHFAAVAEARRLLAMVLANNPAFVKLAGRDAIRHDPCSAGKQPMERALEDDPYFKAYCHLSYAMDVLKPVCAAAPSAAPRPGIPISQQIVTLEPSCPVAGRVQAALPLPPPLTACRLPAPQPLQCAAAKPVKETEPCSHSGTPRVEAARSPPARPGPLPVLETRGERIRFVLEERTLPALTAPDVLIAGFGPKRDEAQVSIVRRDEPVRRTAPAKAIREPGFLRLFHR